MKKSLSAAFACMLLAGCASVGMSDKPPGATERLPVDTVVLTEPVTERDPADLQVLFWNDAQRSARFRDMEAWFAGHEVPAAATVRELPQGAPLSAALQQKVTDFIKETNSSGVMILEDGKLRHSAYGLGFDKDQRWTSFSVAKSFTSTLLGAAVKDGKIASLQENVVKYVPELAGSAYDGVTIEQVATMTSGVQWNEDYGDPKSDVARMGEFVFTAKPGEDAIVNQLKELPRAYPAGEGFTYKTGETNLLGVIVERAVGMSLAEYSKSKIVDPAGFEGDMFWMTEPSGRNIGGCCLSLKLSDYARMGQFALEGGGEIVPEGWFAKAGDDQVKFGDSGYGYGYQWWTYPGDNYGAQGIFGQAISILPEKKLVAAAVGNWEGATSQANRRKWEALMSEIASAP
ncbi:serine hydrolase domain-containing protein [Altererythrobacter sp. ZODW24]|uniref:serine hydrolase domain-containing protein n=1 Tax=Altererythrobacter sp. ZODW24 TaxID=2185142 RepID=UPI000DF7B93D|nr:serine hydrolase domain-containing protein [Altererythrobacter sp. ZODW24]